MTNQGDFDIIDFLVIIQTFTQMQNNSQLDKIADELDILIKEVQNARDTRNDG